MQFGAGCDKKIIKVKNRTVARTVFMIYEDINLEHEEFFSRAEIAETVAKVSFVFNGCNFMAC